MLAHALVIGSALGLFFAIDPAISDSLAAVRAALPLPLPLLAPASLPSPAAISAAALLAVFATTAGPPADSPHAASHQPPCQPPGELPWPAHPTASAAAAAPAAAPPTPPSSPNDDDPDSFSVFIRLPRAGAGVISLHGLRPSDSVAHVKRRLADATGLPAALVRLVHRSRLLDDSETLAGCAISRDSELAVTLPLRGGERGGSAEGAWPPSHLPASCPAAAAPDPMRRCKWEKRVAAFHRASLPPRSSRPRQALARLRAAEAPSAACPCNLRRRSSLLRRLRRRGSLSRGPTSSRSLGSGSTTSPASKASASGGRSSTRRAAASTP